MDGMNFVAKLIIKQMVGNEICISIVTQVVGMYRVSQFILTHMVGMNFV